MTDKKQDKPVTYGRVGWSKEARIASALDMPARIARSKVKLADLGIEVLNTEHIGYLDLAEYISSCPQRFHEHDVDKAHRILVSANNHGGAGLIEKFRKRKEAQEHAEQVHALLGGRIGA